MRNWEWEDEAMDEVAQKLRELPCLPAPGPPTIPAPPRSWLQPAAILWLLLLPLTAYLIQQRLATSLAETALQATPYPHWQGLLNDAHHLLQTGLQWVQEVLG